MSTRALAVVALLAAACGTQSSSRSTEASGSREAASDPGGLAEIESLEVNRADPGMFAAFLAVDVDPIVRARAALALARAEHTAALPLLYQAAKDPAPRVRASAFFGLGQMGLALEVGRAPHDELRGTVENVLVANLAVEQDAAARGAIARALGRVSTGPGLDALVRTASGEGPLRAGALTALGVAGWRLQASRKDDLALREAVARALTADDASVRRAASYVAFRQQLPLTVPQVAALARDADAQTRIHAARALGARAMDGVSPTVFLDDADWRVRVEALRAIAAGAGRGQPLPTPDVERALTAATTALLSGRMAEAHVVAGACDALAVEGPAPADVAPILAAAFDRLGPVGDKAAAARCSCAVAADAVKGAPDRVARCAPAHTGGSLTGRLAVRVWAKARVPSRERAAHLEAAMQDPERLVRIAAATALADDGSEAALEAAARALGRESDPNVAAALLEALKKSPQLLDDAAFSAAVARFVRGARNLEEAEPLLALAEIARTRTTPEAREAVELLKRHPEPRVRETVLHIPTGERAFGPRAKRELPPAPGDLPLAAVLHTERGDVRIAFERELAPVAVANFAGLAQKGFFKGTRFHRVVADFVDQGGDPQGDGSGGPGFTIPCENSDASYSRGAVGMALGGKDTGGSQFFLTHSDQPHLDGRYSVFARVVDGLDVMDAIQPDDRLVDVSFLDAVPKL